MANEKPKVRVKAGSAPSMGYLRGEPGITMPNISPVLRDRSDDVRVSWTQANARANDAQMNSGWIAGAVEQVVASMIGNGLRLNAKPDGEALGWDEATTSKWARNVERRFETWSGNAYECDAGGRYTRAQMEAAHVRQWIGTGEMLSAVGEISRPGAETRTKIRLLPSHWLSQQTNALLRLDHGVYEDGNGLPIGYDFEIPDPLYGQRQVRLQARDAYGRPRIVHIFDGAAGQKRGITPLAPALKIVRQYDQLSDATLTAAMIHAIFAATIESDYPTPELMAAFQDEEEIKEGGSLDASQLAGSFDNFLKQKVGWHKNVNIDLGRHGKIAHLLMGEKLQLRGSEHPNSTYEPFAKFLLREIASCLGINPSDVTGDYAGDTYSSIRMGIAKKWPLMEYRRKHLPARFAQAAYEAWLEEDIDAGRTPFPGGIDRFVSMRSSIVRADWRGPPKPQADDGKAANAHKTWYSLGVMSQEMICNDLGVDHEDVHEQLERERLSRERRGLPDPTTVISGGGGPVEEQETKQTKKEDE